MQRQLGTLLELSVLPVPVLVLHGPALNQLDRNGLAVLLETAEVESRHLDRSPGVIATKVAC